MHTSAQRTGLRRQQTQQAFGPPISEEERNANIQLLEKELNRVMKCPGGRNQVYIRSLLTGSGTTTPRIALKCVLRKDVNLDPEIFYEDIRDTCCANHEQCPAWQAAKARFMDL